MGSRDGAVVGVLASHQCNLGLIPGLGVSGLSLLLVLVITPRGFSPFTLTGFPLLKNQHFQIPIRSLSCTQSPQAFWLVGGRQERLWRIQKNLNFLIGCPITVCIVLPQKSCGNNIPVPQSLSWRPTTGQGA